MYLGPLNGDDALQGASNKDQQILCAYSPWQSWGSCFSESGNTGSGGHMTHSREENDRIYIHKMGIVMGPTAYGGNKG